MPLWTEAGAVEESVQRRQRVGLHSGGVTHVQHGGAQALGVEGLGGQRGQAFGLDVVAITLAPARPGAGWKRLARPMPRAAAVMRTVLPTSVAGGGVAEAVTVAGG